MTGAIIIDAVDTPAQRAAKILRAAGLAASIEQQNKIAEVIGLYRRCDAAAERDAGADDAVPSPEREGGK